MKIKGEEMLPGTPERVWPLLLDPDVIEASMPGCQDFHEVEPDRYKARVEAGLGPITSAFDVTFTVSDKLYPTSYRLDMEGDGSIGRVRSSTRIELTAMDGQGTRMSYDADADVSGKVSFLGKGLIESAARLILEGGFKSLRARVAERLRDESDRAA